MHVDSPILADKWIMFPIVLTTYFAVNIMLLIVEHFERSRECGKCSTVGTTFVFYFALYFSNCNQNKIQNPLTFLKNPNIIAHFSYFQNVFI